MSPRDLDAAATQMKLRAMRDLLDDLETLRGVDEDALRRDRLRRRVSDARVSDARVSDASVSGRPQDYRRFKLNALKVRRVTEVTTAG